MTGSWPEHVGHREAHQRETGPDHTAGIWPRVELAAHVRAYVAVTDPDWLRRLFARGVREANFWQPRPSPLRLERGTPWIFKVRGTNLVGGYGFFTYRTVMPAGVAWETFGPANGVESFEELRRRIASLRHGGDADDAVGCVVLSDVTVLDERRYVRRRRIGSHRRNKAAMTISIMAKPPAFGRI